MSNNLINKHVDFSYKNATLIDPFLSDVSVVTLNKNYLPISAKNSANLRNKVSSKLIRSVPNYIQSEIRIYYAGTCEYIIPVLFPEAATESYGASFVKESPVGSSHPIIAFANSNATTVSVSFTALSDHLPSGYNSFEDYINAIKHMTIPKTSGSIIMGPEVTVSIANLVFSGVCDSVSIEYKNIYGNNSYTMATISCQFTKSS